jgi:hypothetical protein
LVQNQVGEVGEVGENSPWNFPFVVNVAPVIKRRRLGGNFFPQSILNQVGEKKTLIC